MLKLEIKVGFAKKVEKCEKENCRLDTTVVHAGRRSASGLTRSGEEEI